MDEAKFTKGPWTNAGRLGFGHLIAPNIAVAYGGAGSGRESDGIANADLIAAAHDLYAALTWFIDDIDGTHTVMLEFDANVERARAALSKARGQR